MIDDLKLIDNIDILSNTKLVLYGAGYRGIETLEKLREAGYSPVYFCDGDPQKWGAFVDGVEVLSLNQLKQLDENGDIVVIIATDQVFVINQIESDMAWSGIRTKNIFTLYGLTIALAHNGMTSGLYGANYDIILDMGYDTFWVSWVAYCMGMFTRWAKKETITLVYSSSKTGSSTLLNSLTETGIQADHIHELACDITGKIKPHEVEKMMANHKDNVMGILKSRRSVKIVTLVREPIGRTLSHVFHLIGHHEFKLRDIPCGKTFIDSITKIISYEDNRMFNPTHDTLDWFDIELKEVFGIDVYAFPFDKEKGYTIIKEGNTELLVLKLEKMNSLEPVIAKFVGTPRLTLVNDNESEDKPYKYLYNRVKELFGLPDEVLDRYYKDPRMAHFYTGDEISGFRKKWNKNTAEFEKDAL